MKYAERLGFEQLRVGDQWVSQDRLVSESDIHVFAELTGDLDPLHLDPDFAAESPFGKQIAHGILGLSFLAGLSSTEPAMRTVALISVSDWRFVKPIYIDDRIHVITQVVDLQARGRKYGEVRWLRQLLNQDGHVVQEGFLTTMVERGTLLKPHTDIAATQIASVSEYAR